MILAFNNSKNAVSSNPRRFNKLRTFECFSGLRKVGNERRGRFHTLDPNRNRNIRLPVHPSIPSGGVLPDEIRATFVGIHLSQCLSSDKALLEGVSTYFSLQD